MTKFDKSLRFGQALEQRLLDRLLVPFRDAVRVFGKDSRCDIKIPELDITIEVKSDITSRDTGNIVVEYFHNAPSGILKSTADYWMFDTGVEEIWISRQRIVLCILVEQLSPAKIHGADAVSYTHLTLPTNREV